MARTTTDIIYNVTGQTLTYRVLQGQPSSATYIVLEDTSDDDATAEFSGSATVDSVSTTVDVTSGLGQVDQHKISLAATTSIAVGTKYLISDNSKKEWVEPIEIVSADYIRVRHPLRNSYSTSATFVGTTISAAVDSTWVAAEENISDHLDPNPDYRVRWAYVVSGVTYIAYSYLDLVRSTVTHQVDIEDLNARAPGLHDTLPFEYQSQQGRSLIDSAWRATQAKLASLQIDTDAIRDDQFIDELVILRSLYMLAMGGWKPLGMSSSEYIAETRTDFERFIEQHIQVTLKHPLASGSSAGVEIVNRPPSPIWSK
jgi:hypothetical protein